MYKRILCTLLCVLLLTPACALAEEKMFYLTIDDTPSDKTGAILDLLQEAGIPATFFVVGYPALHTEECWENLRRIEADGHTLACHGYNHARTSLGTPEQLEREVRNFNNAMTEILGHDYKAQLFRFPYGSTNEYYTSAVRRKTAELGMLHVDWNASNGDGTESFQSDDEMFRYAIRSVPKEGDVVMLVHDNLQRTVRVLPRIIEYYKEQGYTFARLEPDTDLSNCLRLSRGPYPELSAASGSAQ